MCGLDSSGSSLLGGAAMWLREWFLGWEQQSPFNFRKYTQTTTQHHKPEDLHLQQHCCLPDLCLRWWTSDPVQGRIFLDVPSNCQETKCSDIANLAHDVWQDGTWWTNESPNYCHDIIVEHKTFSTKSPAWVAVEHGDDNRHVCTCKHSGSQLQSIPLYAVQECILVTT